MKELKKLINVKSLVTLFLTGLFCYLSIAGKIEGREVVTIFTTVMAFYFGTQHEKKGADVDATNTEKTDINQ